MSTVRATEQLQPLTFPILQMLNGEIESVEKSGWIVPETDGLFAVHEKACLGPGTLFRSEWPITHLPTGMRLPLPLEHELADAIAQARRFFLAAEKRGIQTRSVDPKEMCDPINAMDPVTKARFRKEVLGR